MHQPYFISPSFLYVPPRTTTTVASWPVQWALWHDDGGRSTQYCKEEKLSESTAKAVHFTEPYMFYIYYVVYTLYVRKASRHVVVSSGKNEMPEFGCFDIIDLLYVVFTSYASLFIQLLSLLLMHSRCSLCSRIAWYDTPPGIVSSSLCGVVIIS